MKKTIIFLVLMMACFVQAEIFGNKITGSAYLSVASKDAPAAIRARADYVCDGVDDQIQIQLAIDAALKVGGTVKLSGGTFRIGQSDFSPDYLCETNVSITKSANTSAKVTCTVVDGSVYNVNDFLRITGGGLPWVAGTYAPGDVCVNGAKVWRANKTTTLEPVAESADWENPTDSTGVEWTVSDDGAGKTLESRFSETYAEVLSINGNILTLGWMTRADNFTKITIERCPWAICIKRSLSNRGVYLEGSGIQSTYIKLQNQENCIGVYLTSVVPTTPLIHSGFSAFELDGNRGSTSGTITANWLQDWRKKGISIGVAIGAAQDWHVQDVAVWFFNGPGVVTCMGWGNHWIAGWVEYCNGPCIWQTSTGGDVLFDRVKSLSQNHGYGQYPSIRAESRIRYNNGIIHNTGGYLNIVELRNNARSSVITLNRFEVAQSGGVVIKIQGNGNVDDGLMHDCTIVDNKGSIVSGGYFIDRENLLLAANNWLVTGNVVDANNQLHMIKPRFTGSKIINNLGLSSFDESDYVMATNTSVSTMGGFVYQRTDFNMPGGWSVPNKALGNGVERYGVWYGAPAANAMTRMMIKGKVKAACTTVSTPYGTLLTLSATGYLQTAVAGDWIYAIAYENRDANNYVLCHLLETPIRPYSLPKTIRTTDAHDGVTIWSDNGILKVSSAF